jgi:uncharacterized protein
MEIQHKEGPQRGKFYIEQNGERVAVIAYSKSGDKTLVIEHTEVDEALRGQNIGYALVERTVEHARSEGLKVSPVCPYAAALFKKNKEWSNVLA